MSAKQFFKSTAFKCIAVLVSIVLVCGVLLTICNSLFYVSDQERLDRAIAKIYGQAVTTETVSFTDEQSRAGDATVLQAYKVKDDGNYLIKCKGDGGFSGGTVTCWVVVKMSGSSITGIQKVVADSSEGQTQMSYLTSSFYEKFSTGFRPDADYSPDNGYLVTDSTKSSTAVCNSVNGALIFVKTVILGQTTTDPFEGFEYISQLNKNKTSYTVLDNGNVEFSVTTKGGEYADGAGAKVTVDAATGAIVSYTITKDSGSDESYQSKVADFENLMVGKTAQDILALIGTTDGNYDNSSIDSTLHTGATEANYLYLYAGLFATANYEKALEVNSNE